MLNYYFLAEFISEILDYLDSPDCSGNPFVSRFFNEIQKIVTKSGTEIVMKTIVVLLKK